MVKIPLVDLVLLLAESRPEVINTSVDSYSLGVFYASHHSLIRSHYLFLTKAPILLDWPTFIVAGLESLPAPYDVEVGEMAKVGLVVLPLLELFHSIIPIETYNEGSHIKFGNQ